MALVVALDKALMALVLPVALVVVGEIQACLVVLEYQDKETPVEMVGGTRLAAAAVVLAQPDQTLDQTPVVMVEQVARQVLRDRQLPMLVVAGVLAALLLVLLVLVALAVVAMVRYLEDRLMRETRILAEAAALVMATLVTAVQPVALE